MQAIILAGGLGTRLRTVVADLPKTMAPICGKPFLAHLLDRFVVAGFDSAILAVGYLSESIREHFGERYRSLPLTYSIEPEPLGTGGAIKKALDRVRVSDVFVVNGDTYVEVDYPAMLACHARAGSTLTLAAQQVSDASRYGALDIDSDRIRGFFEKGRGGPGVINAGVYVLRPELFDRYPLPHAFSFENDVMVPHVKEIAPLALPTRGMFIDIGVPEDYARAQTLLHDAGET